MRYETGQINRLGDRPKNQDRVAIVESQGEVLMVLADGLGGHQGGEVAAQTAVESFMDDFGRSAPVDNPAEFLHSAFMKAHRAIVDAGRHHSPPIIPRTTCVVCLIKQGKAYWMHIGDSRLYVFRNGNTVFRTMDHSIVEQLFQQGLINEEERAKHPKRHHITRCLGGDVDPEAEVGKPMELETGDIILMCSDGLWDPMGEQSIGDYLRKFSGLDDALVEMSYEAENRSHPRSDNISVAAFQLTSQENKASESSNQPEDDSKSGGLVSDDHLQEAIDNMKESIDEYRKQAN